MKRMTMVAILTLGVNLKSSEEFHITDISLQLTIR